MKTALIMSILLAGHMAAAEDIDLRQYVHPSGTVTLASGEPMQVTCRGAGAPAAVLLTGSGGWSNKWAPLHHDLAKVTRSCTIDRPGWGMAGVGRGLLGPDMIEDYREAMTLAGEKGPYVIVGHSQGGSEALFWGDRYRDEIAGLVLLDPGMPDLARQMQEHAPLAFAEMRKGMQGAISYFRECADSMEAVQENGEQQDIDRCMPRADDPVVLEALTEVASDPARFRFNADEIERYVDPAADPAQYSGDLGDLPVLILQATIRRVPPGLSEKAKEQFPLGDAQLEAHHARVLGYSTRAELRRVDNASHDILADRPDAIVEALEDIVTMIRHGKQE